MSIRFNPCRPCCTFFGCAYCHPASVPSGAVGSVVQPTSGIPVDPKPVRVTLEDTPDYWDVLPVEWQAIAAASSVSNNLNGQLPKSTYPSGGYFPAGFNTAAIPQCEFLIGYGTTSSFPLLMGTETDWQTNSPNHFYLNLLNRYGSRFYREVYRVLPMYSPALADPNFTSSGVESSFYGFGDFYSNAGVRNGAWFRNAHSSSGQNHSSVYSCPLTANQSNTDLLAAGVAFYESVFGVGFFEDEYGPPGFPSDTELAAHLNPGNPAMFLRQDYNSDYLGYDIFMYSWTEVEVTAIEMVGFGLGCPIYFPLPKGTRAPVFAGRDIRLRMKLTRKIANLTPTSGVSSCFSGYVFSDGTTLGGRSIEASITFRRYSYNEVLPADLLCNPFRASLVGDSILGNLLPVDPIYDSYLTAELENLKGQYDARSLQGPSYEVKKNEQVDAAPFGGIIRFEADA